MRVKKCGCPIWVHGRVGGKLVRRSLGTRNWDVAQHLAREWELGKTESVLVAVACDRFKEDCKARGLSSASVGKYKLLTAELGEWFAGRSVASITVDELREYRERWKLAPISAAKKLERLRSFFGFCVENGWCEKNLAKGIRLPVYRSKPTMSLTPDEFEKVVFACDLLEPKGIYRGNTKIRARAFVKLLRYSGLRIRDAVLLTMEKLDGNKLLLYSAKTGVPVYLPLPTEVVNDLKFAYDITSSNYFFWSGSGDVKSCVNDWQRTLGKLAKLSGVKFHAHMLRDTFAVELLQKGVSLENVATLLGNTVKVAERHYSPWVKSRQLALEAEIEKAWKLN